MPFTANKQIAECFHAVNITPAAEKNGGVYTGDYVSMANALSITFIVNFGAIAAGGGHAIKITQATAAAGTGAKDLVLRDSSDVQDSPVAIVAGAGPAVKADVVDVNGYVTVADTDDNGCALIHVRAEELDTANDFDYITVVSDADPGASCIMSVTALLESRYADADGDIDPTA